MDNKNKFAMNNYLQYALDNLEGANTSADKVILEDEPMLNGYLESAEEFIKLIGKERISLMEKIKGLKEINEQRLKMVAKIKEIKDNVEKN